MPPALPLIKTEANHTSIPNQNPLQDALKGHTFCKISQKTVAETCVAWIWEFWTRETGNRHLCAFTKTFLWKSLNFLALHFAYSFCSFDPYLSAIICTKSTTVLISRRRKTGQHIIKTLTFEHGADLPHTQTPLAGKLAKGKLKKEQRNAAEDQHDEVR